MADVDRCKTCKDPIYPPGITYSGSSCFYKGNHPPYQQVQALTPTPHQHSFTIPVEFNYIAVSKTAWKAGDPPSKYDYANPIGYRVTKLRCECGEEIDRA